ncbi:MAG: hypothetical protein ABSG02_02400 [Terriglobales bacterium]
MHPRISTHSTAIAIFAALVISLQFAQAQQKNQPPQYYVFNLGSPLGGPSAAAASINNVGWIAGDAYPTSTTEHAELWVGVPLDLGTLGGPNSAVGWPNKNDRGEIAGIAETAEMNVLGEAWSCALANFFGPDGYICYGFVWQDGVMTALPPLPGGLDSYASAVNNHNQVVGWAENGVHDSSCNPPQVLQFEAIIWGPELGQMRQLPPLSPDPDSAATAINDKGQVVGISGLCSNAVGGASAQHAVLWQNGTPINLGNFDGGVAWNTPTAINNRSEVVGFGNLPNTQDDALNPVAFMWTQARGIQQIAPLSGDGNDWAWGVNIKGQVVGQSFTFGGNARAFLYQDGLNTDLNSLIQPDSSLYLLLANDINDSGEIVGYASDSVTGETVAFLAVPVSGSNVEAVRSRARAQGSSQKLRSANNQSQLPFSRFAPGASGSK